MKLTYLFIALIVMQSFCSATPVSSNLIASFDEEQSVIKLRWQLTDPDITGCVLQKSTDNIHWDDLYVVESANAGDNHVIKYIDGHPDANKNNYRLKLIRPLYNEFSQSIVVIMGRNNGSWIIYPMPVVSVLNLQYTGSEPITGVISVFIYNASGKVLGRLRSSSLNRIIQIPVSNLGRGVYDVSIMINDKLVWNQRFVK